MADLAEVHKYNIPQLCSLCKTGSMKGKILKAIPLTIFLIHESQHIGHWLHNHSPLKFSKSFYY